MQPSILDATIDVTVYMVGWFLSVPAYLLMLPVILRTDEDSARLTETMEQAIDNLFPEEMRDSG